jgi:hypothetical protein
MTTLEAARAPATTDSRPKIIREKFIKKAVLFNQ